ncbi:hypothetical protein [Proteus mirabilis]|uniref:hypothetical protein n=1 Tax=Proteus mirabilis TaxID=584 RepID=UPI000667E86E|nr:hypothetical protein [Proteus mirabilis]MCU9580253.1 hypothetical protein [Proteus mirabilis]MDU6045854.1 hypothetical protein [Proteus mirabilis]HEK2008591.1 hypothetical protein [Proteus mirabilis]
MFMELDFNYPKTDDYVSKEFFVKRKIYKGRSVIDEIELDQDLSMATCLRSHIKHITTVINLLINSLWL